MENRYKNNYPCVFLHGIAGFGEGDILDRVIGYWGTGPFNVQRHLKKQGIECYNPNLGPFGSAWDRSCELYAYLFGGTVDYGKVHSARHHHARYGRTYAHGKLEDLGENEAHKKMNILGHSFGGPAVKMFSHLMIEGSAEEREATEVGDLNPLFQGGKGHLIHTVTTLSGVNNGTTYAESFGVKGTNALITAIIMMNSTVSRTCFPKIWDFHIQQWGAMDFPENIHGFKLTSPFAHMDAAKRYTSNTIDSSPFEMHIDLVQDVINPEQKMSDHIYYFCHRACSSHKVTDRIHLPNIGSTLITYFPGFVTGTYIPRKRAKYGVDESWLPNDGFVNVKGQSAPIGKPQADGEIGKTDFKPGIWYNMPVVKGDHLVWNSMNGSRIDNLKRYDAMVDLYRSLPDA